MLCKEWGIALLLACGIVFVLRGFVFGLYHVSSGSGEPHILVGDRVWGNKLSYSFGAKPKRGDLIIFSSPKWEYSTNPYIAYWQKHIGLNASWIGLPAGPDAWVKRVIALPGDTIEGRVENGRTVVYLNGEPLDERYINPYPLIRLTKKTGLIDLDSIGPLPVPSIVRVRSKQTWYSFDSDKSLDVQPFYTMFGDEIVYRPGTIKRWVLPAGAVAEQNGKVLDQFGPLTIPGGNYWVMGDSRSNSCDSRMWGFVDESLILGKASFVLYSIDSEEPLWLLDFIKNPLSFWTKHVRWSRCFTGIA